MSASPGSALTPFETRLRPRLVFGAGAMARLGELARELGSRRALVVTDAGIVAAGHVARGQAALEAAGLSVAVFDAVRENPTTLDVERCLEAARAAEPDLLVGLGGGSSLDTAKGCNFLLTNGGRMQDYWGTGLATREMLPLIAVPTTAGTGSECQSYALIADEATHQKMACGDPKAAPRVALLDPELTVSQPRVVTACTGIDAVTHAVESAVSRAATPFSRLYSREAFRLLAGCLERVLEAPEDLEARAAMQLGAAYAGIAIEHSMLGAAHSCANPLTARYGTVHGQAVGVMLPHVIRFNAAEAAAAEEYRELAARGGLAPEGGLPHEALAARIERLLAAAGIPASLAEHGVTPEAVSELAAGATQQWTARFNPREVGREQFEELYQAAL